MPSPVIPPLVAFVVVWLLVGTVLTWLFQLIGFRDMKHVGTAFTASLVPALIVLVMLS